MPDSTGNPWLTNLHTMNKNYFVILDKEPNNCNFDKDMCNFESPPGAKKWSRNTTTSSPGTGTKTDHTTGKGKAILLECLLAQRLMHVASVIIIIIIDEYFNRIKTSVM